MVDTVASSLAPSVGTPNAAAAPPAPSLTGSEKASREFLFDSIAREGIGGEKESHASPVKAVFTVLLWTGYVIAIAVALVLVWSAARELL